MKKERNSNIEILRIISIILIVISHYCVHNGIDYLALPFGISKLILELGTLGNLGTILFVLITGYYLVNSEKLKISRVLKIEYQVLTYSILIYLVLVIIGYMPLSINELIHNAFPIIFGKYWFATAYITLYFLHPFINKILNNITRKEYLYFIGVLLVIDSVIPTILNINYYGTALFDLILFYVIGGYLRKYPDNILKKYNKVSFIVSIIVIIASVICIDKFQNIFNVLDIKPKHLLNRNSLVAIVLCVSLFDIFSRKKYYSNKLINNISGLIFGVYLFSDNQYIRSILWIDLFKNASYINNKYMIIHLFICVFITVIVSLVVEFIRKKIFDDLIFDNIYRKVEKCLHNGSRKS